MPNVTVEDVKKDNSKRKMVVYGTPVSRVYHMDKECGLLNRHNRDYGWVLEKDIKWFNNRGVTRVCMRCSIPLLDTRLSL